MRNAAGGFSVMDDGRRLSRSGRGFPPPVEGRLPEFRGRGVMPPVDEGRLGEDREAAPKPSRGRNDMSLLSSWRWRRRFLIRCRVRKNNSTTRSRQGSTVATMMVVRRAPRMLSGRALLAALLQDSVPNSPR